MSFWQGKGFLKKPHSYIPRSAPKFPTCNGNKGIEWTKILQVEVTRFGNRLHMENLRVSEDSVTLILDNRLNNLYNVISDCLTLMLQTLLWLSTFYQMKYQKKAQNPLEYCEIFKILTYLPASFLMLPYVSPTT